MPSPVASSPTGPLDFVQPSDFDALPTGSISAPEQQSNAVAEDTTGDPLSVLPRNFEQRAQTIDDIRLGSEINNRNQQLRERQEQYQLANQTADNKDAIGNVAAGVLSSIVGGATGALGGLVSSIGLGHVAPAVVEDVTTNSANVAANEITRLSAEIKALEAEQARREKALPPGLSGPKVSGALREPPTGFTDSQLIDFESISNWCCDGVKGR